MSDPSFEDILNTPAEDAKPPVALPVGTYLGIVDGQPEFRKIGQKQTDCVNFSIKPIQAQEDVDKDKLSEALNGKSLQDKKIYHRLFITEDAKWRLVKFLHNDCGIDKEGKNIKQMIPEAMGRQVMVVIGHRAADDGSTVYQEVKSTAHV